MKIRDTVTLGLVLLLGDSARGAEATRALPKTSADDTTGISQPPARKIEWKNMDVAQRKSYMKKVVLPAMQKVFAGFDAQKYAKLTCYVCHGDGVSKGYEMPNGALLKLPTELGAWKVLQDKKPDMTQFMANEVKPRMAALLGEDEWTPTHQDGFGCYSCHAKVGSAATGMGVAPRGSGAARSPQ
jgi:hypothetical protein